MKVLLLLCALTFSHVLSAQVVVIEGSNQAPILEFTSSRYSLSAGAWEYSDVHTMHLGNSTKVALHTRAAHHPDLHEVVVTEGARTGATRIAKWSDAFRILTIMKQSNAACPVKFKINSATLQLLEIASTCRIETERTSDPAIID